MDPSEPSAANKETMNDGELPPRVRIRHELRPGDIGYLTYLHGVLYAKEFGWDYSFETYVALPLSGFATSRSERERIWLVDNGETLAGSIAIVQGTPATAQVRWFLLHPDLRGRGIGKHLLEEAIQFCREQEYHSVFLWTESRLRAAAALYNSAGFQLTEEKTHQLWGATVTEQRYEMQLE